MDITLNATFLIIGMGKMRGIRFSNTRDHRFTTTRTVIGMITLMLPFDTFDMDEVIVLVKCIRILDLCGHSVFKDMDSFPDYKVSVAYGLLEN